MGEVIDLDAYRPVWDWGLIRCQHCGHEWTSVYDVRSVNADDLLQLECPACRVLDVVLVWIED